MSTPSSRDGEIHDPPSTPGGGEQVVECLRQFGECNAPCDAIEIARLQRRCELPPDAQLEIHRVVDVDADQPHAAENEREYARAEIVPAGVAHRRADAVALHGSREPGELLAADRVHCTRPPLV